MKVSIHPDADRASAAATECLVRWLTRPSTRNVMVAGGNTPLELYRRIAERRLALSRLNIFALDEYVGVPLAEPRNCANLLRRSVAEAWNIPPAQFFAVSSLETDALASVREHERGIEKAGGLDVIVLGLGRNGHLGFNEPGSAGDSPGRVLDLEASSIEANRKWFGGDYAPAKGVTVGLKTILATRHVLVVAYGPHKKDAVKAMVEGPRDTRCPASFLQGHPEAHVFLDAAAASALNRSRNMKTSVCAIGLDVGGTKVAAGIVTPDGEVIAKRVIPTLPKRGGEAVLTDALALAESLRTEAMSLGHKVSAIGVGVGELVDLEGNVVSEQTILWRGLPVRERFAALAPAVIAADSRAAAFCEAKFGAGRNRRIFLYLTLGTGIGSCLVLDGVPYTGARGATGTLASSPLTQRCTECGSVLRPVLEEIASGPGLVARYNRLAGASVAKAEEVLAAAAAGDSRAVQVVESAAEALGATAALMVNVLDPEAIVIGGGLGMAGGLHWEIFLASTRRHIWSDIHRDLPIVTAAYGGDAGLVGAAALAFKGSGIAS